ncbi:hypothetical protein HUG15_18710 [Salicibibacter cibarius]|uniref:BshB3 potential contributor to bacillithiol synthesis n=1 Tax=Salicibibacter cibarius TaxID=2743000 RepID=A0A7T6Z645_9BACI|nr:hypothetical protein [Salicibibacter cibarius]QQK77412.1 hypothetical protein HUG15_18710 [Salicibibacter cibarius]
MNLGIIVMILLAAGVIVGITLAIGRNDNNYNSESSFKLMTIMYTVVVPIVLIIAVVVLAAIFM